MMNLRDIPLHEPLPALWSHGLLVFSFILHFVFVLLTLGTAILGVFYFIAGQFGRSASATADLDRPIMGRFFVHKSMAIVLAVGPLLLMLASRTVPFLSSVNLLAPLWMSLIVLLIVALLLLELLAERRDAWPRYRVLAAALAGLAALLAVPATFSAVLTLAERSGSWRDVLAAGGRLPRQVALQWLFRLLHVLLASVVFTAGFLYLSPWAQGDHLAGFRRSLRRWMFVGLLVQFVVGLALYAHLPAHPTLLPNAVLMIGIAASVAIAFALLATPESRRPLAPIALLGLLMLVLVPMLLTRQLLQDRAMLPVKRAAAERADEYRSLLAPYRPAAAAAFAAVTHVPYDNPATLYFRSCQFCHGTVGNGAGDDAPQLRVPPEDLPNLRLSRPEFRRILLAGVPGTAMPTFGYYLENERQGIMDFVYGLGMKPTMDPPARAPDPAALKAAQAVWTQTCSVCHGLDGRGAKLSAGFSPPPPDLTRLSVSTNRAAALIAAGYPGTMMPAFSDLPADTRAALVALIQRLYQPEP